MKHVKLITRPGLIPLSDGHNWSLDGDFIVEVNGHRIIVPKGFKTDLASIPPLGFWGGIIMALAWLLRPYLPLLAVILAAIGLFMCLVSRRLKAYGKYTLAAVLHDWLFKTHLFSFTYSNIIFLMVMRYERTARWERAVIWFNVQLFGYWIYKSKRRRSGDDFKKQLAKYNAARVNK